MFIPRLNSKDLRDKDIRTSVIAFRSMPQPGCLLLKYAARRVANSFDLRIASVLSGKRTTLRQEAVSG